MQVRASSLFLYKLSRIRRGLQGNLTQESMCMCKFLLQVDLYHQILVEVDRNIRLLVEASRALSGALEAFCKSKTRFKNHFWMTTTLPTMQSV